MPINSLAKRLFERLLPSVPIIDDKGRPTPEFVRKWDEFTEEVEAFEQNQEQTNSNVGQSITNITNVINNLGEESQIYVGPESEAPETVTRPLFMILRENGAPAGQTSFVIREPD